MKAWIVIDAGGKIYGTHTWGSDDPPAACPITAPVGGQAISVDDADALVSLVKGGQQITIIDGEIRVNGTPIGTITDGKVVLTQ